MIFFPRTQEIKQHCVISINIQISFNIIIRKEISQLCFKDTDRARNICKHQTIMIIDSTKDLFLIISQLEFPIRS